MMKKIILFLGFIAVNPLHVSIYSVPCHLEANYYAEQVFVSNDGVLVLYFADGRKMDVPLKFVDEVQVNYEQFLRSYSLDERGHVLESKTPKCKGAI